MTSLMTSSSLIQLLRFLSTADCDDITADVIIADLLRFLSTADKLIELHVSEAIHAGLHVRIVVHVSKADKLLFFISILNYFVAFQLLSDFSSYHLHTT
ncbi:hypothetical protein F511_23939 [Dorcoceras hygrometricum]|uniref:Uncharacterized protein n=1 Tax=Dorcoceras hygrometricum TaxID=472368 RepID=A0A2Z7B9T7_9LAMI|nr:hypothetical protein F511_23939 [Dorcoceras hygrometricum]